MNEGTVAWLTPKAADSDRLNNARFLTNTELDLPGILIGAEDHGFHDGHKPPSHFISTDECQHKQGWVPWFKSNFTKSKTRWPSANGWEGAVRPHL